MPTVAELHAVLYDERFGKKISFPCSVYKITEVGERRIPGKRKKGRVQQVWAGVKLPFRDETNRRVPTTLSETEWHEEACVWHRVRLDLRPLWIKTPDAQTNTVCYTGFSDIYGRTKPFKFLTARDGKIGHENKYVSKNDGLLKTSVPR